MPKHDLSVNRFPKTLALSMLKPKKDPDKKDKLISLHSIETADEYLTIEINMATDKYISIQRCSIKAYKVFSIK